MALWPAEFMSCRFMAVIKVWRFYQRNLNETVSLWRPGRWVWGRRGRHRKAVTSGRRTAAQTPMAQAFLSVKWEPEVGVDVRDLTAFFHCSLNVLPIFKGGTALPHPDPSLYYQLFLVPPPMCCSTGNVSFHKRGFASKYWPLQLLDVFCGVTP